MNFKSELMCTLPKKLLIGFFLSISCFYSIAQTDFQPPSLNYSLCLNGSWNKTIDSQEQSQWEYRLWNNEVYFKGTLSSDSVMSGEIYPNAEWILKGSWKINKSKLPKPIGAISYSRDQSKFKVSNGKIYELLDSTEVPYSGYLRITFIDGSVYVGSYKNGLKHGKGEVEGNCECSIGIYNGKWKEGKPNGKGTFDVSAANITLYGKFKDFYPASILSFGFSLTENEKEFLETTDSTFNLHVYDQSDYWVFTKPESLSWETVNFLLENRLERVSELSKTKNDNYSQLWLKLSLTQVVWNMVNGSDLTLPKIPASFKDISYAAFINVIKKYGGVPAITKRKKFRVIPMDESEISTQ